MPSTEAAGRASFSLNDGIVAALRPSQKQKVDIGLDIRLTQHNVHH